MQSSRPAKMVTAIVAWSLMLVAFAAAPAAAQGGCGEISFSFDGTRLLNDGISNSAGPFPADIAAGLYTVTLIAADEHDAQVGIESQTGEQYRVVLDSGYTSPLSIDIPDDVNSTTTVFDAQQIGESTAISVEHGGADGINSVDVVCVGFTAVAQPDLTDDSAEEAVEPETPETVVDQAEEPAEPTEPEVVLDPTEEFVADEEVADEEPVQDIGDPVTISRDPDPAEPAEETAVLDESVVSDSPEEPVAADQVEADEVSSATPDEEVEVEVLGDTETAQVPLLAITGPDDRAFALVSLALLMIVGGGYLVSKERRLGQS